MKHSPEQIEKVLNKAGRMVLQAQDTLMRAADYEDNGPTKAKFLRLAEDVHEAHRRLYLCDAEQFA